MLARRFAVIGILIATASFAISVTAMAAGPRIVSTHPPVNSVPRFGKFEMPMEVEGAWKNPFNPAEADVSVDFTSPSGIRSHVAAFYTQDFTQSVHTPQDDRRSVASVKFYTEERGWRGASGVEFFFDDVTLVNSETGATHLLDDMESGDVRRWGGDAVSWSTDVVHTGSQSLRFAPHITEVEHWPGPVMGMNGANWSAYDGMVLWVYPRYKGIPGTLSLYFTDGKSGNSPIQTLSVGQAGLLPNRWNRIAWSWKDFPSSLQLQKQATPHWLVRFTPTEVGQYVYGINARDSSGTAAGPGGTFTCSTSTNPGFVRVSPKDSHYFTRDDGKPFLPIGHDVSWDLKWAMRAFPKMAAHGENATYCILVPWETSIEWGQLGRYDLERAAKVDSLIELAATYGIYVKLSFDVHDALRRGASWEANPYASQRGGPCKGPNDFYTSPVARELYKRRLRYMIARWGYCPNVMAWETVAEIDGATEMPDGSAGWGYPTRPQGDVVSRMLTDWLSEIHGFMRSEDPYGRLLTVSLGGDVNDPRLWQMPEVQYVQLHHYDSLDPGRTIPDWCRRLTIYGKPFLITESGWWADWTKPVNDPHGLCQHDGLWASVMGGASGSAFSWWWEQIDALNLYPYYLVLNRFLDRKTWTNEGFRPAETASELPKPTRFNPVTLSAKAPFDGGPVSLFRVGRDGSVNDPGQVPEFLLAPDRSKSRGPVFMVDNPVAGELRIHLDSACIETQLKVAIDGDVVLTRDLPVQNVPGKVSKFDEKWKVWSCQYNEDLAVPVPAGHHVILVENAKPNGSWIRVTSYTFTNYTPPNLNVVGLTGVKTSLLWIQNTESTWWNAQQGLTPGTISDASVIVAGLRPGRYAVEWWDTYTGRVTNSMPASPTGGKLTLHLPPFQRDIALKLRLLPRTERARKSAPVIYDSQLPLPTHDPSN